MRHLPLLTHSNSLLLGVLTLAASGYVLLLPIGGFRFGNWGDALRLAAFGLVVFLVSGLVLRDVSKRVKLEQEASRLVAIVKSSEDAIISHTLDGTILAWNPGAERLFGYSANKVVGHSIQIIYPPDRLAEFQKVFERLQRGESIDPFDTVRVDKDGQRIDVSMSETLIRDAQGLVIGASGIVRDIRERKRTEGTARFLAEVSNVLASSLDYETTFASVARLAVPHLADWCAVHIQAEDGTIQRLALTHIDPAKVELAQELHRRYLDDPKVPYGAPNVIRTGQPRLLAQLAAAHDREALGMPLDPGLRSLMVVPLMSAGRTIGAITFVAAESGRHYGPADLALAQDLAHRAALAVDNARLYRKAQSLNEDLDQRVAQRTLELQEAVQGLETEIAEHRHTAEQLRLLAAHLQSAREEERIRIAREIHDEIGTLMTAIKMDLAFLGREIGGNGAKKSPETLREEIGATTKLVDDAIQTTHQIVRELRPGVLDHLGLRAALEWQIQEFQARTKIESKFNCSLTPLHLDSDRSTAVFRILQEVLTNVARHAHATRVDASLREEDHSLVLEVHDNGGGISDAQVSNINTFGLLGMRERAHVFGGDIVIRGSPGQGTTVTVRIPV